MSHPDPLWTRMPALMLFLYYYLKSSSIFHYIPSLHPLLSASYKFAHRRGKCQFLESVGSIVQQVRHRSVSM